MYLQAMVPSGGNNFSVLGEKMQGIKGYHSFLFLFPIFNFDSRTTP